MRMKITVTKEINAGTKHCGPCRYVCKSIQSPESSYRYCDLLLQSLEADKNGVLRLPECIRLAKEVGKKK